MQLQLFLFPQLFTSWITRVLSAIVIIILLENNATMQGTPCDKSRQVFDSTWGVITDGPIGSNYTKDSHCEWLIKAKNSSSFITLTFQTMGTECSFDYVFVYDGESFDSPLLGSFSGKTEPQQITATSGSMLILLYSDTNYVLGGFEAEFSVTDCPRNCTKHGNCILNTCACDKDWGGEDCSIQLCPDSCGSNFGRGICLQGHCICSSGYSGQSCSLHINNTNDNSWHWLSSKENGLVPRAAHTAIYDKSTDSLYVFGGYDLNNILGDLSVYRFNTSSWDDERQNVLDRNIKYKDDLVVNGLTGTFRPIIEKNWGFKTNSFPNNYLHSLHDNSSTISRPQSKELETDNNDKKVDRNETISDVSHSTGEFDFESEHILKNESLSADMYGDNFLNITKAKTRRHVNSKPSARYGHAACRYNGGFVIYGGKLADGDLSNELWFYNVVSRKWSLRAMESVFQPPKLTRHTLTVVDDDIYLFGGSTVGGEFSSKIYFIKLNFLNGSKEQWELIRPRGGKELDVRIVAHTTVYHRRSHSLLVYGGVMADVARFSKLSDRMFLFKLSERHWSEIHYPRAHLPDTYVPRERAFHTSTILGNYLVVFGGYTHRHNKEEICYDNQMYLYHLGCHTWVSHDILGQSENGFRYRKHQGVFAHAADVRNGNTLLVFGGYHGNMNADLWAYVLPPTLATREGIVFEPEQICSRHHTLHECTSNPECGWCSADEVCYGRTVGVNCTTNLQTTRCPGVCPALGDCHSCLIHGESNIASELPTKSVVHKLKLGQCIWCVQNARCHHKDDNYGVCGLREDTPSQSPGWWGHQGTEISWVEECRIKDRRPGLTFIKYHHPVNWSQPDSVSIINATTADFDISTKETRMDPSVSGGAMIARLLGFLRIPDDWMNVTENLKMCTSFSNTVLRLSQSDLLSQLQFVGNVSAESSSCQTAMWPFGKSVVLHPGRYLVDFESNKSITAGSNSYQQSKMALMHNKGRENSKTFTFEYLEPYQNGSCHLYSNCLHCLTDSLCGWCDLTEMCVSRTVNESEVCKMNKTDDWHYLTLQPSQCVNCSNYISCEQCVGNDLCEWWVDEARCFRRGFSSGGTVNSSRFCPTPCYLRRNCSQCLDDKGLCVWCEATQECFSFSIYTSEYQFGLCREWIEKSHDSVFQSNSHHVNGIIPSGDRCKSCSKHTNCSSCLHTLSCGWCYDLNNPIVGACVSGSFTSPQTDTCAEVIQNTLNHTVRPEDIGWSYAQCPDVNECLLKLDNCHSEAICTNTDGSFTCECKRGFYGDGRHSCIKTCYNKCINGVCTMAPDYRCQCDLGWTGDDCGTDCNCNKHSTCEKGVGVCDECQDWTTGDHCQFCKIGSYGNATSKEGCRKCECNGHGDESLGLCDSESGICFCQHNTEGDECDACKKGYYGNPKNGGICYFQCAARGVVTSLESQGIGSRREKLKPWESRLEGSVVKECLWILNSSALTNTTSQANVIQLNIDNDLTIDCQDNSIFVFDGLPDLISPFSHQNHALGTFCQRDDAAPLTVETKSGILTVLFKQGADFEGFNASFNVFTCPGNCPPNRTCLGSECVCSDGFAGPNCSLSICPQNCSFHLKQGYCDKGYGRCVCRPGYGSADCSVEIKQYQLVFTELFNSAKLSPSFDHLRKMIPRFGHSLVTDRRGSLWMFGGYSLSHGPLNDIRLFDTKNNTWMQVTVDSTRDAAMPQGRYFHAAEIVHSRREIFVFGGITAKDGPSSGFNNNTLKDFWKFSIKHQRWIDIEISYSPPPLAGHTLTLMKDQEKESLLLVGGFSPEYGFLNTVWNYNLETEAWSMFNTSGNRPIDVCGHTNVYHSPTKSFYLFGGYMFSQNRTIYSNKLYSFHYPSLTWSLLPTFAEYNPISSNLPQARFLHSAITTKDYMLIFGGRVPQEGRSPTEQADFLVAYTYSCNQWIRLLSRDTHIVGTPPPLTYGQAMTYDPDTGSVYIVGGFDNAIQNHVTRVSLPGDLCNLWNGKDKCRSFLGCSFCTVIRPDNTLHSRCYSSLKSRKESCDYYNGTLMTNNGVVCDGDWFEKRSCQQFKTCTECLAKWPAYLNEKPVCRWCTNCTRNKCIGYRRGMENFQSVTTVDECKELSCLASSCERCREMKSCAWVNQSCMKTSRDDAELESCPPRCFDYKDCASCLTHHCRWSTTLKECISPDYQPLYCAGGVCGLVLKEGGTDKCPEPCSSYTQCSTCLTNSHCGWCALSEANGQGLCTEGSLTKPLDHVDCRGLFSGNESVSWNYVTCPEENECENDHHTCNRVSEECIDLKDGFRCDCGPGYRSVQSQCEPVCSQGCVRGVCTAPNECTCDFGYVGVNCSIQCQCNGHSECAGPDKLDTCIECQNNTMGKRCEKCKPLFVGNPVDNGHCIPCYEYCNEHSHICINDPESSSGLLSNKSLAELSALLEEGPVSSAWCIGCVNKTTGRRCNECLEGYFRGTEDLRQKCRPCECHGHGNRCDPVTGEKCNCANNTESDCPSSFSKNSNQQCWMMQCSKCMESYSGTPTDGHQCYKQMTLDLKFCLDSRLIDYCGLKPRPLYPGQSVFFQVQPRYVNVDIRVILDVTQGSLDLYMSPRDDSLVVSTNSTTGWHTINWDSKYKKRTVLSASAGRGSIPLPAFDMLSPEAGNHNRSIPDIGTDYYLGIEKEADGLTTYITINEKNTFLHVKNISDRVIITLPKDKFDLVSTRFYLALTASPNGRTTEPSYGVLFFRQDQLHIDLFVFFSVFFSCFFLFLAGCVVAWKAKQAADVRRARRRHVVEMLHMAKRPFAGIILHLEGEESSEDSSLLSQSPQRKKRSKPSCSRELRPVAIEPTDDGIAAIATVFVRLPGGADAPVQLSLASSLIMMSRVYPLNSRAFLRRRSSHHGPV